MHEYFDVGSHKPCTIEIRGRNTAGFVCMCQTSGVHYMEIVTNGEPVCGTHYS